MGCSVGFKYAKNALTVGAPPRTPLGELTTLPQTSYSEADRRGQGAMAPKPWITKLKLSCRVTYIDALALLMTIKQLINIAALRHFKHITTQKSVQL